MKNSNSNFIQFFFQISTNKKNIGIENKIKKIVLIDQNLSFFKNKSESDQKNIITTFVRDYLNEEYSQFINEVASHFSEINESILIQINPHIFRDIISSGKLSVTDEDTLLNVLLRRRSYYNQNENFDENEYFLNFIQFEFLSEKGIATFLDEIDLNEIDHQIWENLKKRLILPVTPKSEGKRKYSLIYKEFLYNDQNQFKGILKHLTDISHGNIHTNGTVEVKCSDLACGSLQSVVDIDSTDHCHVRYADPGWIQIDFKSRKVQINSYLIKSGCCSGDYLKSWRFEVSNDGDVWEKIDEQNDVNDFNHGNIIKIFNVKVEKPSRYIRIISNKIIF